MNQYANSLLVTIWEQLGSSAEMNAKDTQEIIIDSMRRQSGLVQGSEIYLKVEKDILKLAEEIEKIQKNGLYSKINIGNDIEILRKNDLREGSPRRFAIHLDDKKIIEKFLPIFKKDNQSIYERLSNVTNIVNKNKEHTDALHSFMEFASKDENKEKNDVKMMVKEFSQSLDEKNKIQGMLISDLVEKDENSLKKLVKSFREINPKPQDIHDFAKSIDNHEENKSFLKRILDYFFASTRKKAFGKFSKLVIETQKEQASTILR
jgi:hypothetical protein